MTTTTIDIVNGHPVPDRSTLDQPACMARKAELERGLVATRGKPERTEERKALVAEMDAIDKRLREIKEAQKQENIRRNFAGIGSPLHEACMARLDAATVLELERDALARFDERLRVAAERKAAKAGKG